MNTAQIAKVWFCAALLGGLLLGGASPAQAQDSCAIPESVIAARLGARGEGAAMMRPEDYVGCEARVADQVLLIQRRLAEDLARTLSDRFPLTWHEARFAAAAGQYERAAVLLRRALAEHVDSRGDAPRSWVTAHLAFVTRDADALREAREQLAVDIEHPPFTDSGFAMLVGDGMLERVDGMIRCFERPYAEAITRACRS